MHRRFVKSHGSTVELLGEPCVLRLVEVTGTIGANPTSGPFSSAVTPTTGYICDLSAVCKISHCQCNYSGSGTSSTASSNTSNPWTNGTVLRSGSTNVTTSQIVTLILSFDKTLSDLNAAVTGVALDVYMTYAGLKQTYTAENSTTILQYWYGVGLPARNTQPLSTTNRIKVCGSGWVCGQGATCTWTVPAGATKARFQVWGAGQGSNPACCCGGSSFAENGAYAEMTLCVTPGDQYVVCAGCSCSRFCCSNETPGYGCMSGVTGPGICCLKADGGHCYNSNCEDMLAMRSCFGMSTCARFQNPYCTTSGPCWCNYGEYCYDNSCATCGVIPVYPACCDFTVGCSCGTDTKVVTHGPTMVHRGLHGGGCLDTNNYGYHIRAPIIDSDTGLEFTAGCRCQTFDSGTCCGGCNAAGNWTWHPGHGGAGTHIMGGTTNHKGDTGRAGMVQISWI